MEERFKRYLEEQFRQIAPTKAAMDYRISMLVKMLDRAQELRIKGMNDEELIYNTVISELGDLPATLRGYENKVVKNELNRRVAMLSVIVGVAYVAALVLSYLIVGFVAHMWHPTWLIIVGGLLLGVSAVLCVFAVRFAKKKSYVPLRASVATVEILLSVTLFLFLQLVARLNGSYLVFLAAVALILGVDTLITFISGSKLKWVELPIFVEVLCVMLYVILGIAFSFKGVSIWHPTWIICLGGVVVALIQAIVVLAKRTNEKKQEEKAENTEVDESYWSRWE